MRSKFKRYNSRTGSEMVGFFTVEMEMVGFFKFEIKIVGFFTFKMGIVGFFKFEMEWMTNGCRQLHGPPPQEHGKDFLMLFLTT